MNAFMMRRPLKPERGYTVLLGEAEHTLASYKGRGDSIGIGQYSSIDSTTLRELSRKGSSFAVCFSPRTIYCDIGEFSSISEDATSAHIRSTLDKIGLFKEDYRISCIRLGDIDSLKARYSYLAIPDSELNRVELVDEDNALVDVFCPIEASLAAALGIVEKNMAILLYEDSRFIRIIAAKDGIIYYLITINAAESFDAVSDTVSGIREATSLLMNSYQEKVKTVYMLGQGEIGREDLQKHGIDAEPFTLGPSVGTEAVNHVLFGTALFPRYDFTTEKLRKTRLLTGYSKISMGVSLITIAIAACFFLLGWSNMTKARNLQNQYDSAAERSSAELRDLENDYNLLSRDLDLSNINAIVEAYKDFQAEPRLHVIMDTISHQVPDTIFLTRVEVKRPSPQQDSPPARVEPTEGASSRTTRVDSFVITIEGIINIPYPRSKEVFSTFMANMQGVYAVNSAVFSHKEYYAEFSLDCEMNL